MPHRAVLQGALWPLAATGLVAVGLAAAGCVAAGATLLGIRLALAPLPTVLLAAACGLVVGMLVIAPLLLRLRALGGALAWLTRGGGVTAPLPTHGWPLSTLFARTRELSQRLAEGERRERQAAEYRERLLQQATVAAAREERNRLARDLHDSIKQQLFSISVSAAAAQTRAEGGTGAADALGDIQRSAHEAQVEMRALLQQLRPAPLEGVGLVGALRDQCEALGYRTGASITVEIGDLPGEDLLPVDIQESVFRIAQEALANIARHARARTVTLALRRQDMTLLLEIRDDGQGFDVAAPATGGGMGLGNLRERARTLGGETEIASTPGSGTTIRVRVPLTEPIRITQEERERQEELAAAFERGKRTLDYCLSAAQIAGLLIFIETPFWTTALAIVLGLYFYSRTMVAMAQVTLITGKRSEKALALRHHAHEWLMVLLLVAALCAWYVPVVAHPERPVWGGVVAALIGSVLLAVAAILQWLRWYRDTERYYLLLPAERRSLEIEKRRVECLGSYGLWGVIVALSVVLGGWHPAVPPRTFGQWADAASIALLAVWLLLNAVDHALTLRWRRRFGTVATEAATEISGVGER